MSLSIQALQTEIESLRAELETAKRENADLVSQLDELYWQFTELRTALTANDKLKGLEANDRRYRWLRANPSSEVLLRSLAAIGDCSVYRVGADLDAAIDRALNDQKKEG